ncbi:TonB-dependent receptor domain-containing protein [Aurantivibrio infirmus]
MKTVITKRHISKLVDAILAATFAASLGGAANAQEIIAPPKPKISVEPTIEEIVVTTRLKDSATSIAIERIEQPFAADVLSVEQITRVGDSNIASALRRVTGLSLVDGKYIYVRGLGERYSSTTLNGAAVPSPELTRNVIPLDLFPTSILQSVKVQKAYSPDQPAAFGGGNIDIRTRGVPDSPVFGISLATGYGSESSNKGLSLAGDGGDLPDQIATAINTYQGDIGINSILRTIDTNGGAASVAEIAQAQGINRELLLSLNRNIEIKEESLDPDFGGSLALGNSWFINDDWTFGTLANLERTTKTRNENLIERNLVDPSNRYNNISKTVEEENTVGALNFGLEYIGKHKISTNSYLIQNDEDQSRIANGFDLNFLAADNQQKLGYSTQLEKRELVINQIIGEHNIEDEEFGFIPIPDPFTSLDINWFYSDSKASTDIPNASTIQASNQLDPITGAVASTGLSASTSVAQFNFLELEDKVESYGANFEAPLVTDNFYGSLTLGYSESQKSREYYGYTANINAVGVLSAALNGTPGQVLASANLADPNNPFTVSLGSGFGTESYVAAQIVDAVYGSFDLTWRDTWRLSAGLRWEDFQQAVLPVDLLDFSGVTTTQLINDLQEPGQRLAIQDDAVYPAVALTYINGTEFLGTQNFQVRLGFGQTVVRPDLREIADVQYIDPELNVRVSGNPLLNFSEIDHVDLRAELFFPEGSNFTAALFYKDITNPIERIEGLASDTNKKLEYINGESGEVYGIEFEGLKELAGGFFLSGNLVFSDSEIDLGANSSQTNRTRRLTGHSKYVVNTQLGFDSENGFHSLSAVYNVFGERVFFGGRDGNGDAFEQPFHSVDLVYSYYPTNNITVKLKLQNLLNQKAEFEQESISDGNITIIEKDVGLNASLDFSWKF